MIPVIILAIENDDERKFMTALYMQYHALMYKIIFDSNCSAGVKN